MFPPLPQASSAEVKWLELCAPVSPSSPWEAVVWELWRVQGNKSALWGQRFVWSCSGRCGATEPQPGRKVKAQGMGSVTPCCETKNAVKPKPGSGPLCLCQSRGDFLQDGIETVQPGLQVGVLGSVAGVGWVYWEESGV